MQVLRANLPGGNAVAALPGFGWQGGCPPLPRSRATAGALGPVLLSTLPAACPGAGVLTSGSSAASPGGSDRQTALPPGPLSAPQRPGGGQGGETVPTGAILVPQSSGSEGPQSGMASASGAGGPDTCRTSGTIAAPKLPSEAAQRAGPGSAAPLQDAWDVQRQQQPLQSQQQQQQQLQQQQQRDEAVMDPQGVHNANAAWTAATWRLISGLQPQP